MRAADEAGIASLLDDLAAAWNRADGDGFAARFLDDADFVEVRGGHHHGRPAIAAGHQAIFDGPYAGSRVAYQVEQVRPLGPATAVIIAEATLEVPVGPLAGTHHSRLSAAVVHSGEAWQIASFHNTLVLAAPALT